jgi:hypothetical protein
LSLQGVEADWDRLSADESSAPRRTRTYNPLIKSRKDAGHKVKQDKTYGEEQNRFVRGFAQAEEQQQTDAAPAVSDPDLARILAAWPTLPAHIKAAIVALMQAAR